MARFRPGISFGDFVVQDSTTRKSRVVEESERDFRRGWLVWMFILVGFGVLGVKILTLQVFNGGKYRLLSDENRIKTIKLSAGRGIIYDRNGVELSRNQKTKVLTGLDIKEGWQRVYPLGPAAAHLVGYVGEVSEDEVGLLKEEGKKYEAGDITGRSGIEIQYEEILRGVDGGRLVEVDNLGKVSREMGRKEPVPGQNLTLSVDAVLQETAFDAFKDKLTGEYKKGAVVVSDPRNGEVLTLVSSPAFDPNQISTNFTEISRAVDLPLFDRSIGGLYPPGSTFKMVTTMAAIGSGKVKPNYTFVDEGVIRVGTFSYYNWLYSRGGGTEGEVGFARALTRSTDTFFYKVGELTGPEEISSWGKKLGLSVKTGIDLPGEVAGLLPVPDWKMETKGEKWFLGDTYIVSIGQGDVLTTPIQVNQMTGVLAAGGEKCPLHLTAASKANKKNAVKCMHVEIPEEAMAAIRKGMIGACSSGGTAYPLFDWNDAAKSGLSRSAYTDRNDEVLPVIACKTGTAEYMAADGKMRTHGWLTAYAPADNPTIAVTALVEGGGEGSDVAAPIVRKILAKYFGVADSYPYHNIKGGEGE